MKKLMNSLFCVVFVFTHTAFAESLDELPDGEAAPEVVDGVFQEGTPGAPGAAEAAGPLSRADGMAGRNPKAAGQNQQGKSQSCDQLAAGIDLVCKDSQEANKAQMGTGILTNFGNQNNNAAQAAMMQQAQAQAAADGVQTAREKCDQHFQQCAQTCVTEAQNYIQAKQYTLGQKMEQNKVRCEQSHKVAKQKFDVAWGQITQLLLAAGMILAQLGKGGDQSALSASVPLDKDDDTDELCSGSMSSMLVECAKGPGDQISDTRKTGLTGTGVGGVNGTGVPMLNASKMGEPGGTSKGGTAGSGSSGGGSSGGGGMPFGSAGFGSGSSGGSGSGDPALDAGAKGYMGVGGGGDGGGGSGGGSGGGMRAASGLGGGDPSGAGLASADTARGMDKLAKEASKRGLASADGKAGPMQSIWDEVSKGYKTTSNTLISGPK